MKSVSIIAIAVFALVALCSSAPVAVQQPVEDQARIDIYNDFLANLFSGLVSTTFGSVSNFLNQLITENPLGVGKRNADDDLTARISALTFLYDNILQDLFSGLVTNTFSTISNTLNNLIQTNPLGVGKRDVQGDLTARIDALTFLYENILQDLFSGLVTNTFSTITNTLNNLIQTNPLGVGKRDVQGDLAARIDALTFLYENILQDLFSGLVTNTFSTISNTLNNLIQTNPLGVGKRDAATDLAARFDVYNDFLAGLFSGLVSTTFGSVSNFLNQLITENPLGVGKRDVQGDLAARIDALTFLYENILQDLFSGLVTNTFSTISNTLNNLIQTNPLGVGKRDVEGDLVARVDALTFLYENILQDLFSGLVTNTFSTISNTLNNLIQTNPLGVGKRATGVNVFQFLYDNVVADLFGGLASNTANYLQNALNDLLNKPFGKRSVNIEEAQALIAQVIPALVSTFKKFAQQALASLSNAQQLAELVKENIAFIKATVANLAQQLSHLIPSVIAAEVSEVLALLQSTLIFWTSGLGGSLGPVIGPFRP